MKQLPMFDEQSIMHHELSYPVRVKETHSEELDRWITQHHYLKSTPAGARLRLWIMDQYNEVIGAMMFGRPVARHLDQEKLLELTRMFMVDDTKPNSESHALSLARKFIRKHLKEIKGLVAYSSTGQHHEGTIYAADNWFVTERTKTSKKGWESRENRTMRDGSEKIRWMRSV